MKDYYEEEILINQAINKKQQQKNLKALETYEYSKKKNKQIELSPELQQGMKEGSK